MSWTTNPIMEWWDDRQNTWVRISDHGRSPLSISVERFENKQRMANGRLRRYIVAKKRTFSCSWDNIPDKATTFLTNGMPGSWMEEFHNDTDGSFRMRLRAGSDVGKPMADSSLEEVEVMISDFSKEVTKRGPAFDLWNLDITLEEV